MNKKVDSRFDIIALLKTKTKYVVHICANSASVTTSLANLNLLIIFAKIKGRNMKILQKM